LTPHALEVIVKHVLNPRYHIAPVLKSVIKHEGGGVMASHAEVALEDPLPDILRAIFRQHTADDRAGGLFAVGFCHLAFIGKSTVPY
jgi:hypothetical protein